MTSAVAGHCIDINGDWWHEPGLCEGARVNCRGDCCQAPTKWVWVQCHDKLYHAFQIKMISEWSECSKQAIDDLVLRSAARTGTAVTTIVPYTTCKTCRDYVYEDFVKAGVTE